MTVGAVVAPEGWTVFTNHGHVLLLLAREPDLRLREVAGRVGITERSAQKIVADLEAAGYVEKTRVGRRNAYRVVAGQPLRHPLEADHSVGELLDVFGPSGRRGLTRAPAPTVSRGRAR